MRYRSFLLLIILSAVTISPVYAGSGAGGIIKFFNDSGRAVSITFSGVGCADVYGTLTSVCEGHDWVGPGETRLYKYNWGVTTTWMNVQTPREEWSQGEAPCTYTNKSSTCFAGHKITSTDANKIAEYHFKG